MERRAFLTTIPVGAAGCLSVGERATGTRPDPPEEAKEPPAFPEADEVRYPASAGSSIRLTADPSTAKLPGATIEFEATNEGGSQFETNLYHWRLHKYVAGKWWFLWVITSPDPALDIDENGSNTWVATVDNGRIGRRPTELSPGSKSSFTLAGVGSGLYAFSIVGSFAGSTTSIAAVVPFELVGEDVDVVPMTGVESTRDGNTIRVEEADPATTVGDEYELTARRRPTEDGTVELVPEWALRQEGIRNTVPYLAEDVDRAVYSVVGHPPVFPMEEIGETTVGVRDHSFGFVEGTTFTHGEKALEFSLREV